MRKPLTSNKNRLAISIALMLGIITASANAQTTRNEQEHIEVNIHDSSDQIVRSGAGECWHTHFGQAAGGECNPMSRMKAAVPTPVVEPTPIPPPIQIEEPVAAPEPPAVVIKKITLDASELFDFGEPILRPSARATLDDFVEKLNNTSPKTIKVIGHTDRFGSASYNQALSEQRAATVKAYLVRKGISPDIVFSEGKGDTQPITTKDQCPGNKTLKTIECLQPDRRVEIEMTGTTTEP